jgi:hypothetical protein
VVKIAVMVVPGVNANGTARSCRTHHRPNLMSACPNHAWGGSKPDRTASSTRSTPTRRKPQLLDSLQPVPKVHAPRCGKRRGPGLQELSTRPVATSLVQESQRATGARKARDGSGGLSLRSGHLLEVVGAIPRSLRLSTAVNAPVVLRKGMTTAPLTRFAAAGLPRRDQVGEGRGDPQTHGITGPDGEPIVTRRQAHCQ